MAAAALIKNLRVTKTGSGSKSLEEAHHRATDFFREACRALPSIMDRYNLYEVITLSELRRKVATEFRKHAHNTNPKVMPFSEENDACVYECHCVGILFSFFSLPFVLLVYLRE